MTDTTTPAQIEQKIEAIINMCGGDRMSTQEKAILNLVGALGVTAANALTPLAAEKIDVTGFEVGMGQALDGLLGMATGVKGMIAATERKAVPEQQAQAA